MEKSNRNWIVAIIVIAVVACLCLGLLALGGAGYLLWIFPARSVTTSTLPAEATVVIEGPDPTAGPTLAAEAPGETQASIPTREPTSQSSPTRTPNATQQAAGEVLDPEVAQQMDEIEAQVVEVRGLEPTGRITRKLLTRDELRQHVIQDFAEQNTDQEIQDDATSLAAFGLLEPGFELNTFLIDLYSEQIAGFYDDETDEMYVVQGSGFEGPERVTYSHEFVHALQDQYYGTETGLGCNDEAWDTDSERCAGFQALIEGDATFTETRWLMEHASLQDFEELQKFYSSMESPVYESAPAFLQEDFLFPYTYGLPFVQAIADRGGESEVDAAFENPPVSTEQILHPEKYPDDRPVQMTLPDLLPLLGAGWREVDRGAMGEWYTYLLLALGHDPRARLDSGLAQAASAGWGGDAYRVYFNEQEQSSILVLDTVWDTQNDADEFRDAFRQYASARFGSPVAEQQNGLAWESGEGHTIFRQDGIRTTWIAAPSQQLAQAIAQEMEMQ